MRTSACLLCAQPRQEPERARRRSMAGDHHTLPYGQGYQSRRDRCNQGQAAAAQVPKHGTRSSRTSPSSLLYARSSHALPSPSFPAQVPPLPRFRAGESGMEEVKMIRAEQALYEEDQITLERTRRKLFDA